MVGPDRHLLAMGRMRTDWFVDQPAIMIGPADHDRQILFLHGAPLELIAHELMCLIVLGDHDHAARVAIEPMHDPRASRTARFAQVFEVKGQGAE